MQVIQLFLFIILSFVSYPTNANFQLNLTQGITPISHDIYNLHMTVIWVCTAIGILVFSVMIYSILYYRKSNDKQPAKFHEHVWLEIAWTIIPALILIVIAIPGTRVLIHLNDSSKPDLTIKITGYQWKWRYEYPAQGIQFFSNLSTPADELSGKAKKNPHYLREVDHPVVVPIHKKIQFLLTSNDVIHAWWVPDLGVKRDTVPGFINESWARINRPGVYYGQCAELCGVNHAFMPIVVIAMTEKDFNAWVAKQKGTVSSSSLAPSATTKPHPLVASATTLSAAAGKRTLVELMKQGEQIYMSTCAVCHKADGTGIPPVFPALKGSAIAKGPLPAHVNRVLNGKPGTAMQAFKDQLNDDDLAAVITYERNALGNNMGDLIQPAQIKVARDVPPAS